VRALGTAGPQNILFHGGEEEGRRQSEEKDEKDPFDPLLRITNGSSSPSFLFSAARQKITTSKIYLRKSA